MQPVLGLASMALILFVRTYVLMFVLQTGSELIPCWQLLMFGSLNPEHTQWLPRRIQSSLYIFDYPFFIRYQPNKLQSNYIHGHYQHITNSASLFGIHMINIQFVNFQEIRILMFLTQTEFQAKYNRQRDRAHTRQFHRSKSTLRSKFIKMNSTNSELTANNEKKNSDIKPLVFTEFKKITEHERKWNKIVDLYNMPISLFNENENHQEIKPGIFFYKMLANYELLKKYKLNINFPETFLEISGDLMMIRTNTETGIMESYKLQRQDYQNIMRESLIRERNKLRSCKIKYKKHFDFAYNPHAPVIVTKIASEQDTVFEIDVESFQNFDERRSKPSANKIIQRFIYPRNMRAIILRICFSRQQRGQQKQQFYAYRFQNVDNIFRVNKKNSEIYETFKLQSTISATYNRENKIEHCKIINMKGLQKYIAPTKQLIRFLEQYKKIKVNSLFLDFAVDLFDKPWMINLKKIEYEQTQSLQITQSLHINTRNSLHTAGSYGICRLCSIEFLKKDLSKSISNKMLTQFLSHLKKRMKVTEYEKIKFVKDIIKKSTKNYITMQVCEGCYMTVAEQYKLIESEHKLAKICNIEPKISANEPRKRPINMPSCLKQWRLMLYFVRIENLPIQFIKQEQIIIRYRLGNSDAIQHFWKLETNYTNLNGNLKVDLNINKIKLHYFYSQSLNINNFLKETQINLHLAGISDQKIFAKGSSSTLSTFCQEFQPEVCLRQTSSVLLFYNDGKYCEMTLKFGLICDGNYQFPESTPLIPFHKVYFTDNSFTNSNPIPRQWMQAFGVSEQMNVPEVNYDEIMSPQISDNYLQFIMPSSQKEQKRTRKQVTRKSNHLFKLQNQS